MEFTKHQLDDELASKVAAHAATHKVSKAEAYTQVLATPEGGALYAKYVKAPPAAPHVAEKAAPLSKAQHTAIALDEMMTAYAKGAFPNDTPPVAMEKFLRSSDGSALYSLYVNGKAAAGAA
ncbi:hypothetical protein [Bradyrhizobium sp. USDA 4520]